MENSFDYLISTTLKSWLKFETIINIQNLTYYSSISQLDKRNIRQICIAYIKTLCKESP